MATTLMNVANNAQTTLAASISSVDTSLTLASATGFPTAPFRITIDSEIIQVGAINTTTKVCSSLTRGVEGTTAASHLSGAAVENRWTAGQYGLMTQAIQEATIPFGVTTGGPIIYAVTLSPAPPSYVDGMAICIRMNADGSSVTPPTINVNGMGAKNLTDATGTNSMFNKLKQGGTYTFRYNAAVGNFVLQGEGGDYGTATAADVLAGKTFGSSSGLVTGTMTNNAGSAFAAGSTRVSGTTLYFRPPANAYYSTTSEIGVTDANFSAANIKNGSTIFGVTGTFTGSSVATGSTSGSGGTSMTVSGIAFTPTLVACFQFQTGNNGNYNNAGIWIYENGQSFSSYPLGTTTQITVSGGSFTISTGVSNILPASTTYHWFAAKP